MYEQIIQLQHKYCRWAFMVVIVWYLGLELPMQSVPITTKVSLNPPQARCTQYNIM